MQEVYLLNDISREDREIQSVVYQNKEDAKNEFDSRVEEHIENFWLTKEDFNRQNNAWASMDLDYSEMYDWDRWVEIYFTTLNLH